MAREQLHGLVAVAGGIFIKGNMVMLNSGGSALSGQAGSPVPPAAPLAAALCEAFGGPIVSTSANASGRSPARSTLQTRLRCPGVDLILSGATGGLARPTPTARVGIPEISGLQ